MNYEQLIESFHEGHCIRAYQLFGAHVTIENNVRGVRFTLYAPHARNVSVVGSFTNWDAGAVPMLRSNAAGIWSVFIQNALVWDTYKYRIETGHGDIVYKADPYAFYAETRPNTASKIFDYNTIHFDDDAWMQTRSKNFERPMSIYEVYAGGWKKRGKYLYTYKQLEEELIPYVKQHGFTHIEMMPLTEYPYDGSWGYQVSGYYALTSRYGNPKEFASFINTCHAAGIGVILDIVPVHFVKDAHGLMQFDGQPLYEYADNQNAFSQWGTMYFNLWKEEIRSFLMSAASFWCDIYHIDGLRFDAVSHLIYWGGNKERGINTGSIDFTKRMNYYLNREYPDVMLIAEDSSDYPKVTGSTLEGGLGFDYKWDLGWMHDTLLYYATDPYFRIHDHHKITFSMHYFYYEKFLLPLSHDENVHGKKTMIDRMWGNYEAKFAQARNFYAYMYAHPGKKLNFMGNEIATFREFDENKQLDWNLLDYPLHEAFLRYFTDLNHLYHSLECLYANEYSHNAFQWIEADNAKQSIYAFYRESEEHIFVCIMNCKQEEYSKLSLCVPQSGVYQEILNSENGIYGGCNRCNVEKIYATRDDTNQYQIHLHIAPWATIWLLTEKKVEGK